jgi:hypothetical protein
MKLSRLIQELQDIKEEFDKFDLDPEVMSTSDYGDHCHTEQLGNIRYVTPTMPKKSPYSDTGLCFNDEDEEDDDINDKTVIALRK